MMKKKRIISCLLFWTIVASLLVVFNHVALNRANNRYYLLDRFVEEDNRSYDVQVYGSCHSYTSFDAKYFEDEHGISSYVLASPGEIIPITYARILERFKTDVPDVLLLDVWGLNPYETYSETDFIMESYSTLNLDAIPYSEAKASVIRDYSAFSLIDENIALVKYKERFLDRSICEMDFNFSFENFAVHSHDWVTSEMTSRKENNGFKRNVGVTDVTEFFAMQPQTSELLTYEDDIVEYLEKIIDLCEKNDVKLIVYRAPYIVTENELKKTNWLENYCQENGIAYYDAEKEIEFDLTCEFQDEYHLNEHGAKKVTDFLASVIMEYLNESK